MKRIFTFFLFFSFLNTGEVLGELKGIREQRAYIEASSQEEEEARAKALEAFLEKFPKSTRRKEVYQTLFEHYLGILQSGKEPPSPTDLPDPRPFGETLEKATRYGKKMVKASPRSSRVLNQVAWGFAEKGVNLDLAHKYSKKAIETIKKKRKPSGMTREKWKALKNNSLADYLDTYGWVYYQQGLYSKGLSHLLEAIELRKEDPDLMLHLAKIYEKMGKEKEAKEMMSVQERLAGERPAFIEARSESDPKEKAEKLEAFLENYPESRWKSNTLYELFQTYNVGENGQSPLLDAEEKALLWGRRWIEEETDDRASALNAFASYLLENSFHQEEAIGYSQEILNIVVTKGPESWMTDEDFKEWKSYYRMRGKGLLGWAYLQLGRLKEAEEVLVEASEMEESEGDILLHLGEVYEKNGDVNKAQEAYLKAVSLGEEKAKEPLEKIFSELHGSTEGLESLIAETKGNEIKAKLGERLNLSAPSFSLLDLDEKVVRLKDLRGKVVVVDFWATWCGPCRREFPYLQTVYEKFSDREDVEFYAINGDEKVWKVKPFLEENQYTIPVLWADGNIFREGIGKGFGVRGIPTLFVIDKKGKIQFKHVGFGGDGEEFIERLSQEIEALM